MEIGKSTHFSDVLWSELEAAGLVLTAERYNAVRSEITRLGSLERDRIVELVGHKTWERTLSYLGMESPESHCIRVLGFGRALTEFLIAPLEWMDDESESVLQLGAQANFIVTLYDRLVDLPRSRPWVLPRSLLHLAAHSGNSLWIKSRSRVGPAPSRMLVQLVADYFRSLDQLPYAKRHERVHQCVKRAILQMYDAEGETIGLTGKSASESTLRRKSALPFVVMGLPKWLSVASISPELYLWHLRWVHRCGDFFGWIDDAVDLQEDLKFGQPNRVSKMLQRSDGAEKRTDLAQRIVHQAWALNHEWQNRVKNRNRSQQQMQDAFYCCLVSWFGGLRQPGPESESLPTALL
ncbi:MAG: hypothetical protein ACE5Q6_14265 [Dehalococcoidia bacterium]